MKKMSFRDKEKNQSALQSLSQALANRDKSVINTGTVTPSQKGGSDDDVAGGASNLLTNGLKLGKTLFDNYKGSGNETVPEQYQFLSNSNFGKTPSDGTLFGGYNLGGANAGSGALQTSEMPTFSGFGGAETAGAEAGGSFLGNVAPYGGIIMGGLRGGMSALNGNDWKDSTQSFFSIDPEGSDVSQTLSGASQGAMMGAPFGPIGMIAGALLGTGASFIDDI